MQQIFVLLFVFSYSIVAAQTTTSSIKEIEYSYIDEEGKSISKDDYLKTIKDKSENYYSWFYFAKDTSIVRKLVNVEDQRRQVSYPAFVNQLEELTGRKFPDNSVFLLTYRHLNDLCNLKEKINTLNRFQIRNNKRYHNHLVKTAKEHYENVVILHFYEEGISINPSRILKKYFHVDKGNFLKQTLFTKPVWCGSSAAIMPGGRTLLRYSEMSSYSLADAIIPENWGEIFYAE